MIENVPSVIEWMYWTYPSAIFIGSILLGIIILTRWDIVAPCVPRKGFLPIVTTRGDRFFIGVISLLIIHLLWIVFFKMNLLWVASVLSISWFIFLGRKG